MSEETSPLIVIDAKTWYAYFGESCECHARTRYELVLELLKGCTLAELNQLVLTDLRPIQFAVGGVPYQPRPFPQPSKN